MSSEIVLTSALRSNLLSLQNTQSLIDKTQLRLATGLKVNSALDNPKNFFAAQSLQNRASDLNSLLDGIGQSIKTIEEADKGITALTSLIQQADSVADSAQAEIRASQGFSRITGTTDLRALGGDIADGTIINNGATDQFSISVTTYSSTGTATTVTSQINLAATDTVDNIVAAINSDATIGANRTGGALVQASVGSGGNLVIDSLSEGALVRIGDGSATSVTAAGFSRLGLSNVVSTENNIAATRNGGTAVAGREVKSAVALSAGTGVYANGKYQASATLGNAGYLNANFGTGGADDVTLTLTVDGQATTIGQYNSVDHTIQNVIDGVNNSGIDGVTASFDTDTGQLILTAADDVGQVAVSFTAEAGGTVSFGFGTSATNQALAAATNSTSENFTFVGSSANLAQYQEDFNNIRSQIDDLVNDASYRGINLLGGDNLTTFFNEDRSSYLTSQGVDFTATGLGIGQADFSTSADVQSSVDDVRDALSTVRNFGQSIANDLAIIQTRRDFTTDTINTLKAGADELTVADQNEEGANLLALQTRQTLGVTSLSLASQSQQAVLRLF
jgi:flagellin